MGAEPKATMPQSEISTGEMPIYYVKGNYYRVIHVDGIYGGGAPTMGNIMMTVFNHRVPLPDKVVNDAHGKEITDKRVVKYGLENELEASLVMSLDTAKIMLQWLDSTIKNTEVFLKKVQEMNQKK